MNKYDDDGPLIWPKCATCNVPYVLRWAFAPFAPKGSGWFWMRDCKHKTAGAVTVKREDES